MAAALVLFIAVAIEPNSRESWTVWSRTLDDGVVVELSFTEDGDLIDATSGTTFDTQRGTGIDGPLADQTLDVLPAITFFEKDYFTFYPTGRLWPQGNRGS